CSIFVVFNIPIFGMHAIPINLYIIVFPFNIYPLMSPVYCLWKAQVAAMCFERLLAFPYPSLNCGCLKPKIIKLALHVLLFMLLLHGLDKIMIINFLQPKG
ncbi:hypothetical protein ACJX0J_027090, partial [Zea mays]